MSLIKNLKRREVEIFGAKRIVRNEIREEEKQPVNKKRKKKAEVKLNDTSEIIKE